MDTDVMARAAYEARAQGEYGFAPWDDQPENVKAIWRRVADAVTGDLAAQEGREAVAWQYRQKSNSGMWSMWCTVPEDTATSYASENRTDIQVRPLFTNPAPPQPAAQVVEALRECLERLEAEHGGHDPQDIRCSTCRAISQGHTALSALASPTDADAADIEIILEDAAKSAFVKAQSVYRADHDHFPLKSTWETTDESVREGWRGIAYAALEAAHTPPLGTQPEPRNPRDVAAALTAAKAGEDGR